VTIPFTADLKAMVAAPLPEPIKMPQYRADNGLHHPSCIYCPQAVYPDAALKAKLQAVVVMEGVIEVNGKAGRITIVKSLGYGLDAAAISAVRKWRFQPALDASGKPMRVRQTIEVQFHLYN
jgi:periplasmic protein TonB